VQVDIYLKVKNPDVTGEAADSDHKGEIEVVSWSWGIEGSTDVATGMAAAKPKLTELRIVKRIDRSSPVIMNLVKSNKVADTATLTMRKAGGTQLPFFVIELKKVRFTSVKLESINDVTKPNTEMVERVNLGFEHVTVTYTPQSATGAKGGGDVTFDADAYSV
jgi:type VI secretion system secreted protein Hcp